jgi:hypothetical protein
VGLNSPANLVGNSGLCSASLGLISLVEVRIAANKTSVVEGPSLVLFRPLGLCSFPPLTYGLRAFGFAQGKLWGWILPPLRGYARVFFPAFFPQPSSLNLTC